MPDIQYIRNEIFKILLEEESIITFPDIRGVSAKMNFNRKKNSIGLFGLGKGLTGKGYILSNSKGKPIGYYTDGHLNGEEFKQLEIYTDRMGRHKDKITYMSSLKQAMRYLWLNKQELSETLGKIKNQNSGTKDYRRLTDSNIPGLYVAMEHPFDNGKLGLRGQGYRIENKEGKRLGYYFLGTKNGEDMKSLWVTNEYGTDEELVTIATLEQAMRYVWLRNQKDLDVGAYTENIIEGHHKKNEYGCLMLDLETNSGDWTWKNMLDLIDSKDLYLPKGEFGYGKESEPHVTVLYGFHTDVLDEDIKEKVQSIRKKPKVSMGEVSSFTNKDFDVLKFDVESKDLHQLNKNFKSFPHTTSFTDYHPHCTIAYLKKGAADKYIKKFNKADVNIEVKPSNFVYSKANGSKKKYDIAA